MTKVSEQVRRGIDLAKDYCTTCEGPEDQIRIAALVNLAEIVRKGDEYERNYAALAHDACMNGDCKDITRMLEILAAYPEELVPSWVHDQIFRPIMDKGVDNILLEKILEPLKRTTLPTDRIEIYRWIFEKVRDLVDNVLSYPNCEIRKYAQNYLGITNEEAEKAGTF